MLSLTREVVYASGEAVSVFVTDCAASPAAEEAEALAEVASVDAVAAESLADERSTTSRLVERVMP